jgi:hypothetical protein
MRQVFLHVKSGEVILQLGMPKLIDGPYLAKYLTRQSVLVKAHDIYSPMVRYGQD